MTQVRWTTAAASDFERIIERIRDDNSPAAQRVARTIYESVAALATFPDRGRVGLAPETRELVFPPWPYVVVYQVFAHEVQILRVRHASRNWP